MKSFRQAREMTADLIAGVSSVRRAGLLAHPAHRWGSAAAALIRQGVSPAGFVAAGAALFPHRVFVQDERGAITYEEFNARTDSLGNAFRGLGLGEGDRIGVLCRNHRYFLEAMVAAAKIGVDSVLLNTDLAGVRTLEIAAEQNLRTIVADIEFHHRFAGGGTKPTLIGAWPGTHFDDLVADYGDRRLIKPCRQGDQIILTSGTTGQEVALPRVALERQPGTLAAIVERVPMRAGDPFFIGAPLFHAWGFGNLTLALVLGATVVLRNRFDPQTAIAAIAEHRVRSVALVPVMAQRLVDLPDAVFERYDVSSVTNVQLSGSAFNEEFYRRFRDRFGEVLFNAYGSTEVGGISYASPVDIAMAPDTAGLPLRGTVITIRDAHGKVVPTGDTGAIHVRRTLSAYGHTPPRSLVRTGDIGHIDSQGRLFITGRIDDMIVSGGENVYPSEIEKLLASIPEIVEAAVVGVTDAEFGQRLRAWVVLTPTSTLTVDEIRSFVKSNLARYKVPRDVYVVSELPRNSTGKIVKRLLQGVADSESL